MGRLNYKTIIMYTLREYDDQPSWNVHIHDDTGHPITIKDIRYVHLFKRTDYPIKEIDILYYKKIEGVCGESYLYTENNFEQITPENILLERDDTGKQYTCQEYEEYIKTHTLKEGGLSDVRRLTKEDVQEYKKRSVE